MPCSGWGSGSDTGLAHAQLFSWTWKVGIGWIFIRLWDVGIAFGWSIQLSERRNEHMTVFHRGPKCSYHWSLDCWAGFNAWNERSVSRPVHELLPRTAWRTFSSFEIFDLTLWVPSWHGKHETPTHTASFRIVLWISHENRRTMLLLLCHFASLCTERGGAALPFLRSQAGKEQLHGLKLTLY